jgi:hypothetical protein
VLRTNPTALAQSRTTPGSKRTAAVEDQSRFDRRRRDELRIRIQVVALGVLLVRNGDPMVVNQVALRLDEAEQLERGADLVGRHPVRDEPAVVQLLVHQDAAAVLLALLEDVALEPLLDLFELAAAVGEGDAFEGLLAVAQDEGTAADVELRLFSS